MRRSAFTLIELLVVVAIIALVTGMVLSVPRRMDREESVRAAAHELAGVLRGTRELAIRQRAMYAVSFNICNASGSSGRVINNRSGGHWYRVLGPDIHGNPGFWQCPRPPLFDRNVSGWMGVRVRVDGISDNPIRHFLAAMQRSWVGDPIHLPAGKVRFLALTDQDNGDVRTAGDTFAPTYPRPWFGSYDPASHRLYPWGGYDPELAMTAQTGTGAGSQPVRTVAGRVISPSGFFYEGYDGIITGCVNPCDRLVYDDTNNDGVVRTSAGANQDDLSKRFTLWQAGAPRPLIDGDWGDFLVVFRPDGTAWTDWMRMRHEYAKFFDKWMVPFYDPSNASADTLPAAGRYHIKELGPSDRCNRLRADASNPIAYQRILADHPEASSWVRRTGYSFITLAADAPDDNDSFASPADALRSITPAYRVAVGVFGDIRVVRVRSGDALGRTLDSTITGAQWQDKAVTDLHYQRNLLTNADGTPRGTPVVDVVTTGMLGGRSWWWP